MNSRTSFKLVENLAKILTLLLGCHRVTICTAQSEKSTGFKIPKAVEMLNFIFDSTFHTVDYRCSASHRSDHLHNYSEHVRASLDGGDLKDTVEISHGPSALFTLSNVAGVKRVTLSQGQLGFSRFGSAAVFLFGSLIFLLNASLTAL